MQGVVFQWLLDIMVVTVVLTCFFVGMKRGLVVSVLRIVSFIVSAAVAHWLSGPAAQWLYDTLFRESIESVSVDTFATFLIKSFVSPSAVVMMRIVVFIALMILLTLLIRLVLKALRVINKIPVIGQLNAVLGGVVGLFNAMVLLFVISVVLSGYNMLVPNNNFINESITGNTYLYHFIVEWNPFALS